MDIQSLKTIIDLICGPFGAVVLMGVVLYFYDKRAQNREGEERISREKLATTFERTVSEILTKSEITQKNLIERAESTERLCEARYTILLQQVIKKD